MFFRDDVMAWNKRVQGKSPNTHPLKPAQLKPLVQRNVKDCIERLQLVSYKCFMAWPTLLLVM